jgi:hypothetical protein
VRPKLVVNEPTLVNPAITQMSATVRSVLRSRAARSSRLAEQVPVRALPECPAELAAEMGRRQPRGSGQRGDVERLKVPAVGEILGPQQVAGRVGARH